MSNITTDQELIQRISTGDEAAFTVLFDQYRDKIYSLAWNLTRSLDTADDILQEVFLKIWIRRAELPAIDNLHGYLVVVTRRVILNELRRTGRTKKRESLFSEYAGMPSLDDTFGRLDEKEYLEILNKGVSQLSPQQAQVFRLIKQQGYSREEVSHALQISPETVKKHLERGTRNLRAFLLAHLEDPLLLIIIIYFL